MLRLSFRWRTNPTSLFMKVWARRDWSASKKTVAYIKKNYPEIFLIADAKRGDIGNTSNLYARAFFGEQDFDAVTVAPYMGEDSVESRL